MRIKFKEPVTTQSGVTYPAGYTVDCDTIVNLSNGYTALGVAVGVHPAIPAVIEPIMEVGARDIHKLEVNLTCP